MAMARVVRLFGAVVGAWAMLVLACLSIDLSTHAQEKALKGTALVIAQSDYNNLDDLANPANDAREIQKLLADLGFEVQSVNDGDRRRLDRQLERFVEDAEEADVALLYYSGHGIEAGGENFLVPVDADLSSLDDADARLVSLAPHVEALKRTVPVAIILLDACRTSPFPAGALLKTAEAPAGLPVTETGLGQPRSVVRFGVSSAKPQEETFGTVIGYSAEPGREALDGEPGGNSPYAEALVRHLSAMQGEEFGMVLRMVAEEVYLKTKGAQRPWVNESLRRLLYLGAAPDEPAGPEGDILRERRRLLVTISALPDPARREIEAISATDSVPMDAIFAMLASLGENAPKDPAELDKILRAQAEKLKEMRAERDAVSASDPEIKRLTDLANRAVDEGAIDAAVGLHTQIKARIGELSQRVDAVEENLKARRLEFAAAFARSAETSSLAFDYRAAARDYNAAFREIERWDRALAWKYRADEGFALWNQGEQRGDNAALREAIATYRDALNYQTPNPGDHAMTRNNIGVALDELASRVGDLSLMKDAIASHRQALEFYTRETDAVQWAWTQSILANALLTYSDYDNDPELFNAAIDAYRVSLEVRTREMFPIEWARVNQNMGIALLGLARRTDSLQTINESVAAFRLALEEFTRERIPSEWANTQMNLAAALRLQASLADDTELLKQSAAIYRSILEFRKRDEFPLQWASTYNNLGNVFRDYGIKTEDPSFLRSAIQIFDEVQKVNNPRDTPLAWAQAHANRAYTFEKLADLEKNDALLEDAIAAYRLALTAWTKERAPVDWAATTAALANVLDESGDRTSNEAHLREAGEAWRAAVAGLDPKRSQSQWAHARHGLARHEYKIGWKSKDLGLLRSAIAGYREVKALAGRSRTTYEDGDTSFNIGVGLVEMAKITGSLDDRRAAVAAFRDASKAFAAVERKDQVARTETLAGAELMELSRPAEAAQAFRAALAASKQKTQDYDPSNTWNELGRALQVMEAGKGHVALLKQALEAFQAAATGFEAANNKSDWAIAIGNLAIVEMSLGYAEGGDSARFARAADHFAEALPEVEKGKDRLSITQARFNLGRAVHARATREGDITGLADAASHYRKALLGWGEDESERADWALNQYLLGEVLQELATKDPARGSAFAEAAQAFEAAATVYPRDKTPVEFAQMRNASAFVRILMAEQTKSPADFRLAVNDARQALSAQVESGDPGNLPFIRDTLCRGLIGIGEVDRDRAALTEAVSACETAAAELSAANNAEALAETSRNLERARTALATMQ
jgi:uncharacterized caspase-like protein